MLSVLEYDTWETVNAAYFLSLLESKEEDNLILAEGPHLIWAPRAQGMTRPKAADFLVLEKECIFLPLELGSLLSVQDSVDTFVIMQIDEGGGLYILIW